MKNNKDNIYESLSVWGSLLITIIISLMFIFIIYIFVSWASERENVESNSESISFGIVQIKTGLQPEIIYDKETQIMYIMADGGYITPLLDSDGKVRKYEEEK